MHNTISFSLNIHDKEAIQRAAKVLTLLGEASETSTGSLRSFTNAADEVPETITQPPAPAAVSAPAPTPTPAPEPDPEPEAVEEEVTMSIKDVRALLTQKVKSNRQAIKDKLTEMGYNNVTEMDPTDYGSFAQFLEGLS